MGLPLRIGPDRKIIQGKCPKSRSCLDEEQEPPDVTISRLDQSFEVSIRATRLDRRTQNLASVALAGRLQEAVCDSRLSTQ